MSESKLSCDCVRVAGEHFPEGIEVAIGHFIWGKERDGIRYLYIRLPGESGPDAIRCRRRGAPRSPKPSDRSNGAEWEWDGDEDKPTLTPSIHAPGIWHGFLIAGRLKSC